MIFMEFAYYLVIQYSRAEMVSWWLLKGDPWQVLTLLVNLRWCVFVFNTVMVFVSCSFKPFADIWPILLLECQEELSSRYQSPFFTCN